MDAKLNKLLLIEDNEDDAIILVKHLKRQGFDFDYLRVQRADEMNAALAEGEWELIISDHALPVFSSSEALEILNESGLDIPLIILSGNIDQNVAVESMRLGARDYIMKDDLTRLAPAINRELAEAAVRSEKRQAEAEIRHLAFHDGLTGLVNRREFEKRLHGALQNARKSKNVHALLYMDLDHFKIVNDQCGHIAGDELLKQVTQRISIKVRSRDTLARIGGDEFCLLLENCSLEKASDVAKSIQDVVKHFNFSWREKLYKIGISIGIVSIDETSESASSLLSAADFACYTAKDKGRNTVQIYVSDDKEMATRRGEMDWAASIDRALQDDSFELFYQLVRPISPVLELAPHYEILLRKRSADGRLVLPGTFIPAAERFYRMVSIDRWVIKKTFERIYQSSSNGIAMDANCYVAINLSGQSLGDPGLLDFIKDAFEEFPISPSLISFEITETAAIANFRNALEFMLSVKEFGCSLALDDFGCGLSSFSYLRNMPVDYLKIDGIFVKNISTDEMDYSIVEAINEVGHKSGARTIAEYVETTETLDCLERIGVDYAQGFGIQVPEPFSTNRLQNAYA
jgi:diguanylate cyclase (GGDEF)-like protein